MTPRAPLHLATGIAVGIAVLTVSSSAPLIAFAAAPALAIAFWRNALAVGVLAPAALLRRRAELAPLIGRGHPDGRDARTGVACLLAGLALAGHFATWIPSAKLTTIASAAALVATQPVWQGLIAVRQGRRLPTGTWVGIGVAVAGAILATGADFAVSGKAFVGDLLALAGAVAGAAYTALGERARTRTSTMAYTTICYSTCAAALLVVCLLGGVPLSGFDGRSWLAIGALTAGAQLLGHSLFNYALHRVSATTLSTIALLEVPGAALIGWVWLHQTPRPSSLPGLGLLMLGVLLVILNGARAGRRRVIVSEPDRGGARLP